MHQGFRKELWTKLVEVLIIDEISMLSGEWLDNLERMLRELTHYYGRGEFQQYLRMPMKDIPASRRCVEINQCVACHHRAGVDGVEVDATIQHHKILMCTQVRRHPGRRRRRLLPAPADSRDDPRRDLPAPRPRALPRPAHPEGQPHQKDLLHEPGLRLPVDGVARGGICVRAPAHVPPHRRVGARVRATDG